VGPISGLFLPFICASAKKASFFWCILDTEEAIMEDPQYLADLRVAEVLERWPETIPVFCRYRMACVGCPIAPFETVAEVAAIYGLDVTRFLNELELVVQQTQERT
jgi:hybrid cluster-associated redox disulfide protein